MKQAIKDSLQSIGASSTGMVVDAALPHSPDTVSTAMHTIIQLATVIGALWPMLKSLPALFKKKTVNEK